VTETTQRMKPLTIDTRPQTYRGPTDWYLSHYFSRAVWVFGTKADALKFAKNHRESVNDCVSWIPRDARPLADKIGASCKIIDLRP
jgi:hypothetical protein